MNHTALGSEYAPDILDTIRLLSVCPNAAQHTGVFCVHVSSGLQPHLFFQTSLFFLKNNMFQKMDSMWKNIPLCHLRLLYKSNTGDSRANMTREVIVANIKRLPQYKLLYQAVKAMSHSPGSNERVP